MPPETYVTPTQLAAVLDEKVCKQLDDVVTLGKELKQKIEDVDKKGAEGIAQLADKVSTDIEAVKENAAKIQARMNFPGASGVVTGNPDDRKNWNLGRFMQGIKSGSLDGVEKETQEAWVSDLRTHGMRESDHLADQIERDMTTTPASDGGHWIPNSVMWDRLIPKVRANSVLMQAGMTVLPDLVGNQEIPKATEATIAYMIGETEAPTASDIKTGMLTMTEHEMGVLFIASNRMLEQSPIAINNLATRDMTRSIALKTDQQGLTGNGTEKNCRGVLEIPGIGSVDASGLSAGDAGIYDLLVDAQEELPVNDVGEENTEDIRTFALGWIFHPGHVREMRKTKSEATSGAHHQFERKMIFTEEKKTRVCMGDPYFRTTQLPVTSNRASGIYANWANFLMGEFTPLRIALSKEYRFAERQTTFLITKGIDFALEHDESVVEVVGLPTA